MSMINDLVNELQNIQSFVKNNNNEEWIDIRLRFFKDEYSLLWGDSSFDPDHRGFWGFSTVHIDSPISDLKLAIKDMVQEIKDTIIIEERYG